MDSVDLERSGNPKFSLLISSSFVLKGQITFKKLLSIIIVAEISGRDWQPSWILKTLLRCMQFVPERVKFHTLKIYLELNIVNDK